MPSRSAEPLGGESRRVNNLLHTLRGEQFRHAQNLKRSTAHLSRAATYSYNDPTLPFSQIFAYEKANSEQESPTLDRERSPTSSNQDIPQQAIPRDVAVPGPRPPKSWSRLFGRGSQSEREESSSRMEALALLFSHLPPGNGSIFQAHGTIASLSQICFQALLAIYSGDDFAEELVPALPPHLRRDMLRWSAMYSPLPNAKLFALCEEGGADGELIIVGPQASLPREYFKQSARTAKTWLDDNTSHQGNAFIAEEGEDESWDSPSHAYTPPPLFCLGLLSVTLPISTLFTFPPTLTHLALLGLPDPAPIHRLPRICPLVEILDLSFNPWLNRHVAGKAVSEEDSEESILHRVEWTRWRRLRVLGLRECGVKDDTVPFVNRARWADVEIIGLQSKDRI